MLGQAFGYIPRPDLSSSCPLTPRKSSFSLPFPDLWEVLNQALQISVNQCSLKHFYLGALFSSPRCFHIWSPCHCSLGKLKPTL